MLRLVKNKLEEVLKLENCSIGQYQLYKKNLENYLESWNLQNKETHFVARQIIHKVVISYIKIIYYLNTKSLEDLLNLIITKQEIANYELPDIIDNDCEIMIPPCELKRVNQGKTSIIGNQDKRQDEGIIKSLKLSWQCHEILLRNEMYASELSKQLGYKTPPYIENILRLQFVSPKIQKMILSGQQKTH